VARFKKSLFFSSSISNTFVPDCTVSGISWKNKDTYSPIVTVFWQAALPPLLSMTFKVTVE
jgi:hypothetical protein